jgi:hypothetical protein
MKSITITTSFPNLVIFSLHQIITRTPKLLHHYLNPNTLHISAMISIVILIFGCLASTPFATSIPSTIFPQAKDNQESTSGEWVPGTAGDLGDSSSLPLRSPTWAVKSEIVKTHQLFTLF